MKNKIISFINIIILMVMVSCDSTFDELSVNPNKISLDSFFETEEQANSAVIGIYGYITTPRNMGVNGSGIHLFRGDEFSNRHDYGWPGQHANVGPNWYTIIQPFTYMYTAIYAANNVLNNVPDIAFSNAALKNAYLGEAHFWRAYAHYFVLTHYRNVVAVAQDADPQELQNQSDPATVWALIISELEQAKSLLPAKGFWDADNKGRITSGAAAALLGKVYITKAGIENSSSDYGLAASEFSAVIGGQYGSYSLVNYEDNFTHTNENNDESLFEFQFRNSDPDNRGFNPGSVSSGTFGPAARGLAPPGFGQFSDAESVVNDWVLETFKASTDANGDLDKRAYATLIFDDIDGSTAPGGAVSNPAGYEVTGYQDMTFNQMYDGSSTNRTYPFVRQDNKEFFAANRKWLNLNLTKEEDLRKSGVNLRVIRYADVLLMYAESVLMGGSGSLSALDAVNQVRTRAGVPNLGAVTMSEIKTERILELTGEGTRFLDLLRWNELSSVIKSRETNYSNYKGWGNYIPFQDNKHEYLPIPITEIDGNPNANQNPGW